MRRTSSFARLSKRVSRAVGHPMAFWLAIAAIVAWAVTGPIFHYSDTWQLIINTATTIITFLMVFLIQNTQNRDTAALQLKIDELIRALEGAHNSLLDLEELTDEEIDSFRERYEHLAEQARRDLKKGRIDTHSPEVKALAEVKTLGENAGRKLEAISEKAKKDRSRKSR